MVRQFAPLKQNPTIALINCSECGKAGSDKASACLYCGFPFAAPTQEVSVQPADFQNQFQTPIYQEAQKKTNEWKVAAILLVAFIVIEHPAVAVLIVPTFTSTQTSTQKSATISNLKQV